MYFNQGDSSYWYEIHGEGTPIVLLHGFTGTVRTWDAIVQQWQNSYQLIIIDLPGHGKTNTSPKMMEDCCKDIKALLDYLSSDKVHMVGYSMGGRTALSFSMLYPDYIQTLVLESASPGLKTESERFNRKQQDMNLIRMIEHEGVENFIAFWEDLPLFASQKELPDGIQESIRHTRLSQTGEGLASSLANMGTGMQPSWWGALSTFENPVLLLAGECDEKYVSLNTAMYQAFMHSDFSIVKNTGHAIHVEQPIIFGKMVMEFIFSHDFNENKRFKEE